MTKYSYRQSTKYQPIKDNAGLHGADIGTIGSGTKIIVDLDLLHDGWVPIVGPYDLGPTWKNTGKQGWIELANTVAAETGTHQYLLTISATDGKIVSCKQLN